MHGCHSPLDHLARVRHRPPSILAPPAQTHAQAHAKITPNCAPAPRRVLYSASAPWPVWWLPFGSVLSLGASLMIDRDFRSIKGEIEELEALKYDFKKV